MALATFIHFKLKFNYDKQKGSSSRSETKTAIRKL